MAQPTDPYGGIRDLIEDSLDELASRRTIYPGDDLPAIRLLAERVDAPEAALVENRTV